MIKVGIIGSGFGLYGLLPAFNTTQGCKVVSICGKRTERLIKYCNSIGLKNIYSNWETMLKKEDLDTVAIAVTPNTQYVIAKTAIQKKINIFAEKPLAVNVSQAKKLFELAKKNKIIHTIDFIFPEIDVWQKAKYVLDKKVLGELKHVSVHWSFLSHDIKNKISSWKTDIHEGGGALSFYFSHSLYYLEYFGGEIENIQSKFFYSKESLNNGEVGVDLVLQFKSGISGRAHLACNAIDEHRHTLIFTCEKGEIILENHDKVVDGFTLTVRSRDKKEITISHEQTIQGEDERVKVVRKLASRFVEACLKHKQVVPSFQEGLRVQQLIEKIRKEGRKHE